jgi:hypothetical protein
MWKGRAGDHDAGGTPKKRGRATRPWRWGQRQRPWFPRRTLSPAAWRRLRLARQDAGQGTEVRPPFAIFPPPSREGIPETAPSPILRAPARGARPVPRARLGRRQGALERGGRRGEKAVEFPIRRENLAAVAGTLETHYPESRNEFVCPG